MRIPKNDPFRLLRQYNWMDESNRDLSHLWAYRKKFGLPRQLLAILIPTQCRRDAFSFYFVISSISALCLRVFLS